MSGKGKQKQPVNLPKSVDEMEAQPADRRDLHPHSLIDQQQDPKRRIGQHQGRGEAPLQKK